MAEQYKSGKSLAKVGEEFGWHSDTVSKYLKKHGVEIRKGNYKVTEDQEQEIIKRYKETNDTLEEIADDYGMIDQAISQMLDRHNVEKRSRSEWMRTNHVDDSAFSELNEEAKYWIGLLLADGNVSKDGNKINLCMKDKELLEKFKHFLNADGEVKKSVVDGYERWFFRFSSEQIKSDLADYGVVPNKTYSVRCKKLRDNEHFWRGYVDGDGHLTDRDKGERERISISVGSVSKELVEDFKWFCEQHVDTNSSVDDRKSNIYRYQVYWNKAKKIAELLYKDCSVCLDYKYERAKKMFGRDEEYKSRSKLNEEAVKVIKYLAKYSDKTYKKIGEKYDIAVQTISSIKTGRNWSHVQI